MQFLRNKTGFHRIVSVTVLGFLFGTYAVAAAESAAAGTASTITERMTHLVLQLAVILLAAKVSGYLCQRFLKIPEVLGELGAGIIIGPHALGSTIGLFPETIPGDTLAVSPELYGIAVLASIILLYLAGLETDLSMFLRYSVTGSAVGVGGVIFSFVLGDLVAVWTGLGISFMDPPALFLGTISTATSVGITARILSERRQLDSPEGVTILSGAVIDDILGIIILAMVIGIADAHAAGGAVPWSHIGLIGAKALGFWLVCTVVGLLLARRIGKGLELFGSRQKMASLSLGLALLLAGLSEMAGLAMIIGAYIMGLSLSGLDISDELQRRLEPVYQTLVSVFFCVMGMMVDVSALGGMVGIGLILSLVAVLAKVGGCALPAAFMGFNALGAFRIGVGMLPRGEVALIVAGVALAKGVVDNDVFGVAIMMTLITTVIAPVIMVKLFDERSGKRHREDDDEGRDREPFTLNLPNSEIAEFLVSRVLRTFEDEECYVHQVAPGESVYQVRKEEISITVSREDETITVNCGELDREFARLVLLEALANLVKVFEGLRTMRNAEFRTQVLA